MFLKKHTLEGLTLPTPRKATEVQAACTGINTPLTDQWNMTERPKTDLHLNSHLMFREGAKAVCSGDKTKLFLRDGAVINQETYV